MKQFVKLFYNEKIVKVSIPVLPLVREMLIKPEQVNKSEQANKSQQKSNGNILSDTTLTDEILLTLMTIPKPSEQSIIKDDFQSNEEVNYFQILKTKAKSVFNLASEIEKQSLDLNQKLDLSNVFKAQVFLTQKYDDCYEAEEQKIEDDNRQSIDQMQNRKKQQLKVKESQGSDTCIFESCNPFLNKTPDNEEKANSFQQIQNQFDEQRKKLEQKRKEFMESFYEKKIFKKSLDSLQFCISPICLQGILVQLLKCNENKEIVYHKLVEMGMLPESSRNDDTYEISDYGTRLKEIQNLILRSASQHQVIIKQQEDEKNSSQAAVLNIKKVLETTDQDRKILQFSKHDFQINNENIHQQDDDIIINSQIVMKSALNIFPEITDPINPALDVKNSQFYTLIHKRDTPVENTYKSSQEIKDSLEFLINQEQISYYPSYQAQNKELNPLTAKQSKQILGDSAFKELENREELVVVKKQQNLQAMKKGYQNGLMSNSLHISDLKEYLASHQKETMTLMQNLDAKFVGDIIIKAFVIKSAKQKQKQNTLRRFQQHAMDEAMLSVPLKLFMDIINQC